LDSQILTRIEEVHKGVVRVEAAQRDRVKKGDNRRGEELTQMEEEGGRREELGRWWTVAHEGDRRRGGSLRERERAES
jgi:hypothetical protein